MPQWKTINEVPASFLPLRPGDIFVGTYQGHGKMQVKNKRHPVTTLRFGNDGKEYYTWVVVQLEHKLKSVMVGESVYIECTGFDESDPDFPIKQFIVRVAMDDDEAMDE